MDIEVGGDVALDGLEELAELGSTMAPMALSQDLTRRDIEGGKQ
jgi:hypothetical protein